MAPVARYAKSGDLNIAYIVEGEGDVDLVWIPPWVSQVEYLWSEPALERVMERLTRFARVITFDRRGSGLSDPLWGAPTLEDQMDDVLAVMDAAGSERAAIAGTLEGGPMAALFAATFPERTTHLVLYATFARATWAPDYEWAWRAEERDRHMDELVARWGEGLLAGGVAIRQMSDPSFMEWAGRLERLAASPATIRRIFDLIGAIDVREVLPSIRVPALVLHRSGDEVIKIEHSRYIASHIPGARFVELEGDENIFAIGDTEAIMGEIEEFITGERLEREPDRMLATVLFTDIVESTRRPPSWVTVAGASCSSATTRSFARRSSATAGARSSAPATASSPPSTAPPGRSAAPPRWPRPWARSASRSVRGCTRASSR